MESPPKARRRTALKGTARPPSRQTATYPPADEMRKRCVALLYHERLPEGNRNLGLFARCYVSGRETLIHGGGKGPDLTGFGRIQCDSRTYLQQTTGKLPQSTKPVRSCSQPKMT
jgi:hypothetical protein